MLADQFFDFGKLEQFGFLYELGIILLAVKIMGHLSKKWGQPSVLGELLAGILLGPMVLDWIHMNAFIEEAAEIGVILLMFLAGLETNLKEFRKAAFASTMVAVIGVIFPFLGGLASGLWFDYRFATSIFIGTALVATSVSISVQTLRELGCLKSKAGNTILGAAVLDDILGIITLSIVIGFVGKNGDDSPSLPVLIVKIIVFFLFIWLSRKPLPKIFQWANQMMTTEVILTIGIIVALVYAFLAEMFGLAGIVGAYFAGLILSTSKFQDELFPKLETISFSFFVPVFFVSIGLMTEIESVNATILIQIIVFTVIAVLTKLAGGAIGAKLGGFPAKDSFAVGAGMVARGEVGLIIASIGLNNKLFPASLFPVMVAVILITTVLTPPLLKVFLPKPEKKSASS
ncbi:MAG: cation:proton antiporter [Thermoactinomyces vulgaris]|jgi:Kef-type K+ transport system membrane component KefB|uniref:cation:proton antiporter n=1 Tax=Thermoactinomyces TaxID=2023 RepID=UPI0006732E66|nr:MULTISPECIES: cation:proton antiporter [Thermoactinomyces]KYQ86872.1 sodium:proton antiporter [Thermoactinomyces sp. AS95]MBH8582915.1 cation:proton antiporter [Thermoactinomyces sp. CICC 10735]MBI0391571.1 cation:proton antiporter [Thermoactinomyces sp. CICC 24226]QBK13729.1 cation:proton antiporter [Thermoactinomyces vulgaris]QCV55094.1 cation:proton antiporter [Thermoactinomyces vulgaris]